jgi:hypothetical protein
VTSPRVRQILFEVLTDPPGHISTGKQMLDRLCAAIIAALPVDGAGVALMTSAGPAGLLVASDTPSAAMEDLQQTLGEGPCLDASRDGRPILLPDLVRTGTRWPTFTSSAVHAGLAAIFAFPLQVGAIRLGVLDLYRRTAGPLDRLEVAEALAFASTTTVILLDLQLGVPAGRLHPLVADAADRYRQIHQATGFVSVQACVAPTEALLLLRARAYASERPLLDVADDVTHRRLTFHPDDDG